MATVIDVARRAGVSLATVSRVLNGSKTVSAEMREKVEAAVQALEFRPNPMARGLRKGQTNTVALLVGDIAQRHFAELTLHIQGALERRGDDLLLYNLSHSEARLIEFLNRALSMRLRAVVIASSDVVSPSLGPLIRQLQEAGIPVVAIGQNLVRMGVPSIVHEERAAARRSVEYLIGKGHRRIAYVGRIDGSAVGSERFRGYRAAMREAGLFDDALVWERGFRYAAGSEAVQDAMRQGITFTALQAGSDEIAAGAMAALHDRGLRVPQDVAVIGFGDIEMGAHLRPALTTLSSHPEEAAALLSPPATKLLRRQLVERGSA